MSRLCAEDGFLVVADTADHICINSTGISDDNISASKMPLTQLDYTLMAVYLTIVGILATVGNLTVVCLMVWDKKLLSKPHNLLILNLALSDLGISLFGYPFTTAASYAGQWLIGDTGCTISAFFVTFFACTDINTLLALSVVRYFIICKPHLNHIVKRSRTAFWIIFWCWGYSLFWVVTPLMGWTTYTFEPFGTSCTVDWGGHSAGNISYTVLMICLLYISHISIMVFCYWKVHVKSTSTLHRLENKQHYTPEDAVMANNLRREKKVTSMIVLIFVSFVLIWSPYAWVAIWVMVDEASVPMWLSTFPTMFAKSSCAINPFIYSFTNRRFRDAFKRMCGLYCQKTPIGDLHTELNRVKARLERENQIFHINHTKEGVYIGDQTIELGAIGETVF